LIKNTNPDNNQYNNINIPNQKNKVCGSMPTRFNNNIYIEVINTNKLKIQILTVFQTDKNPQ